MKTQKQKKILILILSSNSYPSPINEYAQKVTWIKDNLDENIEILFYKAGNKFSVSTNLIILSQNDRSTYGIGKRTIQVLEWVSKNKDYDYVLRINSSSYLNLKNLRLFIDKLQIDNVYAGRMMDYHGTSYISGAGILLSKNLVNLVLDKKLEWDHKLLDDVALGSLLNKLNIQASDESYQLFTNNIFRSFVNPDCYQYRCNMYYFGYPRYLEFFFMKNIHKRLENKSDVNSNIIIIKFFDLLKNLNLNYLYLKYIKKSGKVDRI
jgi:hypothetical protein